MLASTCASNVVGICTRLIPRNVIAAANPVRSPITPPPNATKVWFLSICLLSKLSIIDNRKACDLIDSPDSIS